MKRLALLWLVGCAHSADPTLYTLSERDGHARAEAAGVIELRTPKLAGYLDRHEVVLQVGDRLELARDAEWAEPLDAMLARVLARDLAQRLPHAQVTLDSGHARAEAQVRIDVDVRRFEIDARDQLVLDALVALRPADAPPSLHPIVLTRPSQRADASSFVRGMSELLAQLAEQIALALPRR